MQRRSPRPCDLTSTRSRLGARRRSPEGLSLTEDPRRLLGKREEKLKSGLTKKVGRKKGRPRGSWRPPRNFLPPVIAESETSGKSRRFSYRANTVIKRPKKQERVLLPQGNGPWGRRGKGKNVKFKISPGNRTGKCDGS